jgi:hypothetical protein
MSDGRAARVSGLRGSQIAAVAAGCFRARSARSRIAGVQVMVWYFAGCPNWQVAGQRLRQALDQVGCTDVPVAFAPVETDAEAAAAGFAGSPTFTVDGADLFDTAAATGMLTCRIYATPGGLAGVPEVDDLVAALTEKVTS